MGHSGCITDFRLRLWGFFDPKRDQILLVHPEGSLRGTGLRLSACEQGLSGCITDFPLRLWGFFDPKTRPNASGAPKSQIMLPPGTFARLPAKRRSSHNDFRGNRALSPTPLSSAACRSSRPLPGALRAPGGSRSPPPRNRWQTPSYKGAKHGARLADELYRVIPRGLEVRHPGAESFCVVFAQRLDITTSKPARSISRTTSATSMGRHQGTRTG